MCFRSIPKNESNLILPQSGKDNFISSSKINMSGIGCYSVMGKNLKGVFSTRFSLLSNHIEMSLVKLKAVDEKKMS